jgi:hypothetical protein
LQRHVHRSPHFSAHSPDSAPQKAAQNPVVEHKEASNRALDILSFASFGSTDCGVGQRVA